jgi:hypothetical protein
VVIGLQFAVDYYGDNTQKKTANLRKLESKVIKNRIFESGGKVAFDYYFKYDYFGEINGL